MAQELADRELAPGATWPRSITYRRCRHYRELSPDPGCPSPGPLARQPVEINLCDYWDYLDGMAREAVHSSRMGQDPPLRRLSAFITDACNLRCSYCPRQPGCAQTLDLGWLLDNLGAARALGALFLDVMGLGEPTLVEGLPRVIEAAGAAGLVTSLGSNGATRHLRDSKWRQRLLEAGPLKLRVSLDSAQASAHDAARGGAQTWKEAVRFIRCAVQARRAGSARLGVFINKVVTRHNLADLLRDVELFASLEVDDVHLIPVRYQADLFVPEPEILDFNQRIAPRLVELGRSSQMPWLAENAFLFGTSPEQVRRSARGCYYQPLSIGHCPIQRAQLLIEPGQRPYTCLWARRAGGRPVPGDFQPGDSLPSLRRRLLAVSYGEVNPQVCRECCTARVVEANRQVQSWLGQP